MIRAVIQTAIHHDRKARTAVDRAIHATVDAVINGERASRARARDRVPRRCTTNTAARTPIDAVIRAVIQTAIHHDRKARTAVDRAIHAAVDGVINGERASRPHARDRVPRRSTRTPVDPARRVVRRGDP